MYDWSKHRPCLYVAVQESAARRHLAELSLTAETLGPAKASLEWSGLSWRHKKKSSKDIRAAEMGQPRGSSSRQAQELAT